MSYLLPMDLNAIGLSPVVEYVTEEVRRQGHDVQSLDGLERVSWMLEAWCRVLRWPPVTSRRKLLYWFDVSEIGKCIEREKNASGFRECDVRVGGRKCPAPSRVRPLLDALLDQQAVLTPVEFYKELELIHPFRDGNGRTGKVLLNWLNGTLLKPIFPPSDLFGHPIQNP
jgi:hypothetical protein